MSLDKIEGHIRPQSVSTNEIPLYEKTQNYMSASMRTNIDKDSFLSKKLQEAEKKIEEYIVILNEKVKINEALENEMMRKDHKIQKLYQEYEHNQDLEAKEKQALNTEIQRQRKEYQKQIDDLNNQLDQKCNEIQNFVNELNNKERLLRENSEHIQGDYDSQKMMDDNKRMYRELMIAKDEANKYKLKINQLYNELDSYKSSSSSFQNSNQRLKQLNNELNKALSEERALNERRRDRVQNQVLKMSYKVNELEDASESMEMTKREYNKHNDYLMQRFLDLRDYVILSDLHTSRENGTPGTVRNNLSQVFGSVSKNPMEIGN